MEVTTNGFPKSGNHALVKAVQLLGVPCEVDHIKHGEHVEAKHIFIKRDPRNIICSWVRFIGKPVTDGMFISAFRKFQAESFCREIEQYTKWLSDANTLVIKYESLIADDAEIKRIADYLQATYLSSAFINLPGDTRTWCESHSDFKAIWTDEVERVWQDEGGTKIQIDWGY